MPFDEASPRLAIGAIMKNEAPYILEWVAYHRVLGIDRFYVADNASDDGTTELLKALASLGIVRHVPFPGKPGRPPQLPAYAKIMRKFRRDADWIAFIDADEFIAPAEGAPSIGTFLAGLGEDVGAVALNWAIYGSSFSATPTAAPVIERFTRRSADDLGVNLHYKTIVRAKAFYDVGSNPHLFQIRKGYRTVQVDGIELEHHSKRGAGLSDRIVWSPWRINHYVVKSRAEFDHKKAPRGRAALANMFRDESFFRGHDRNEIEDPMQLGLVEATKGEIGLLRHRLRTAGVPEDLIGIDRSIVGLQPLSGAPGNVG